MRKSSIILLAIITPVVIILAINIGLRKASEDSAAPQNYARSLNGQFCHYVKESGTTFSSITNHINSGWYTDKGIRILQIYCPYRSTGDWRGVPAVDFFDTNTTTGTASDFEKMTAAAHSKGMAVTMYIGLLFVDDTNPWWTNAQTDKKNGVNSKYTKYFRWSDTIPTSGNPPMGDWAYSSIADCYYATSWEKPALNYSNTETVTEIKRVLNFWMDKGVDGFEYDFPFGFWGLNDVSLADLLITTPKNHDSNEKSTLAEGVGYCADDWNDQIGFSFAYLGDPNRDMGSLVMDVSDGNSTADSLNSWLSIYLDGRRAYHQGVVSASPYDTISGDQRAFDAAVLAGSGSTYLIDYDYIYKTLSDVDQSKYDAVFKAIRSTSALAPGASRTRLDTGSDPQYLAQYRNSEDGTKHVLCIYNFKSVSSTITVDLNGSRIGSQTPVNIITGESASLIKSTSYSVSLPAYGYLFLDVNVTPASSH